jgi:hypothetical protein
VTPAQLDPSTIIKKGRSAERFLYLFPMGIKLIYLLKRGNNLFGKRKKKNRNYYMSKQNNSKTNTTGKETIVERKIMGLLNIMFIFDITVKLNVKCGILIRPLCTAKIIS